VRTSIGEDELTGIPTDIAFDNLRNLGGLQTVTNPFSAGAPAVVNGKSLVRFVPNSFVNAHEPRYAFLSVPNSLGGDGVIDVIDLNGNRRIDTNPYRPGIQSIPANNARAVSDYWRQ
jgi:hypothetical protein